MKALKQVLRLNALSCLSFGAIFAIWPQNVGLYIGTDQHLIIMLVGAALLFNGLHLAFASLRKTPLKLEIYYFSLGDILWFSATFILIGAKLFITSQSGIWLSLIVAFGVVTLGLAQLYFYAELNHLGKNTDDMLPAKLSRLNAIKHSWLAMKTWVKIWLFSLNGIFLAALFFLPTDTAQYILFAFILSGPLLMALMIVQRGLTRLLGVAHLIPWLPLLAYLLTQLSTSITYTQTPYLFSYLILLTVTMSICLLLDALDVYRWFQGEKYRLGAKNAR